MKRSLAIASVAQASSLPYRGLPIRALLAALLLSVLALPLPALAQSYAIPWHTIDGGGTSTGGVFRLTPTNWILQQAPSVTGSGTNSSSARTKPVTVPATLPTKFYRLFKP